jgi:hypothetical protein
MALLFHDGYDNYATIANGRTNGWDVLRGPSSTTESPGRFGGRALSVNGGFPVSIKYPLNTPVATIITGFAVNYVNGFEGANVCPISFSDAAGVTQVYILANLTNNRLDVYRGDNTLLSSTSNGSFLGFAWQFVEVKLTVGTTTGAVQIQINGGLVLNLTGINTQGLAASTCANITYISTLAIAGGASGTLLWDDLYICDTTTGPGTYPCNDFLGDCRVLTLFPTANGSVIDFATTAASNFQAVNSFNPDSNTIFNSSETVNDEDLFTITPGLTVNNEILGVRNMSMVRNSDAGSRSVATEIKSGATTVVGSSAFLGATRQYITNQMAVNPVTSASWTFSEVNALEIGYKITA